LKAWDVHNNSSEKELNFNVNQTDGISLNRVFNYPNPFTTKTSFYIEQNVVDYDVSFKLDILTISGKLVKSFSKENMRCRSNVEQVFEWDGLDEFGDQLAKGVYIYRITLSDNRTSTTKMEKLVIF
jgi:flagellar hook assembly protein FlgD